MLFDTNVHGVREEDAEARIFPENIWMKFFYPDMPDIPTYYHHRELLGCQKKLMRISLSEIPRKLEENQYQSLSSLKKYSTWLSIAYAHPEATDEMLIQFGEQLQLPFSEMFYLISAFGKLSLFEKALEHYKETLQQSDAEEIQNIIICIISNNRIDFVDIILNLDYMEEKKEQFIPTLITKQDFIVLRNSYMQGNRNAFKKLIELAAIYKVSLEPLCQEKNCLAWCVHGGDEEIFDEVVRIAQQYGISIAELIQTDEYHAIEFAFMKNHPEMVRKLSSLARENHLDLKEALNSKKNIILHNICIHENPQLFQALLNSLQMNNIPFLEYFFTSDQNTNILVTCYHHVKIDLMFHLIRFFLSQNIPIEQILSIQLLTFVLHQNDIENFMQLLILAEENQMNIEETVEHINYGVQNSRVNRELARFLCRYPTAFAYYVQHCQDLDCEWLIHETLDRILRSRENFVSTSEELFDVTQAEAQICLTILHWLILSNVPEQSANIPILLNLPSVREIAHQAFDSLNQFELLDIARQAGNELAVQALLEIPAFHAYQNSNEGANTQSTVVDEPLREDTRLRRIAENRESSMRALEVQEEVRFAMAKDRYLPQIAERGGVKRVLEALRDHLKRRYNEHPATYVLPSTVPLELPLEWDDLQALFLICDSTTSEQRIVYKDYFEAYFQNKDHTALRYILEVNPWIDPHAIWTSTPDAAKPEEKGSLYENHAETIAICYLAVIDESIPEQDGFTLESRLDLFITTLAELGRAHNWDKTREKVIKEIDGTETTTTEYYDDLLFDNPSCSMGVDNRLYHCVKGHELFDALSSDKLEAELNSFIYKYFTQKISASNWKKFNDAYQTLILEGNNLTAIDILIPLNIDETKQEEFKAYLRDEYQGEFSLNVEFINYVNKAFDTSILGAHVLRFSKAFEAVISYYQKSQANLNVAASSQSSLGFFNQQTVKPNDDKPRKVHTPPSSPGGSQS